MTDTIQLDRWASFDSKTSHLSPISGEQPVPMAKSEATARNLIRRTNSGFGADLIRFGPGERVNKHTHPGEHILLVTSGAGTLTYGADEHGLEPGQIYLVPGGVPHAIQASDDCELVLVSIANYHFDANNPRRLDLSNTHVYSGTSGQ